MQFYEFKETQERVILIGVQTEVGDDVEASLDELEELAETAGAETVAKVIQNREAVHPGTYIGKGKIEEVASLLRALDANGVICDDELSPAQLNNLERELDCKVMDRTLLILDIFAGRAVSSEVRSRSNWHSSVIVRRASSDSVSPCPVWAAVSVREDLERRNWKRTDD